MKKETLENSLFVLGALLLLAGAALYGEFGFWAFCAYATGSVLFAFMQCRMRYEGHNIVVRRLRRQQIIGAVMLVVTAVLMSMNLFNYGFAPRNEWMAALCIACVLELYTAFRIPAELEKEKRKKQR